MEWSGPDPILDRDFGRDSGHDPSRDLSRDLSRDFNLILTRKRQTLHVACPCRRAQVCNSDVGRGLTPEPGHDPGRNIAYAFRVAR